MSLLDIFRPPVPPPDALGLLSRRRLPSDIELARDRAVAQSTARRHVLEADVVNLGLLGHVATRVVESVQLNVEAAATRMPYDRDRVDSVARTVAIIVNEKLGEMRA